MSLKASFVSYLQQHHPQLNSSQTESLISEELLSPFQVRLSTTQIEKIRHEIKLYWKLRSWGEKNLQSRYANYGLRTPENYAVCMSYDFHINSDGNPELIEINTNASFLALGLEHLRFLQLPNAVADFDEHKLAQMFSEEIRLSGGSDLSVALMDEKPEQQRLYVEFLLYQSLLEKSGFKTGIYDIHQTDMLQKFSLIYNRHTDFYLRDPASAALRELFNSGKLQLSPQPYDYFLLADKERLLDWNRQTEYEKPSSLLRIYDLGNEDKDFIWSERKGLFFKPKTSFGSKQAYKGASMSRRVFDSVTNENFVAQQLSTPSTVKAVLDGHDIEFKYDLRCYAYQDQLQLMVARLYQGQTTNLQTRGGGFAAVIRDDV